MDVRTYLKQFYEELRDDIKKVADKEPHSGEFSQAFRVLNNRVAIVGEITDNYMKRLDRVELPLTQDAVRQRLKYVYRDILFVGTMSTIEYYGSVCLWCKVVFYRKGGYGIWALR